MLDLESIDVLDALFDEGIAKSRCYFFMDPNNQGSLYAGFDESVLEYVKEGSAKVPLTRNCRNTRQIGEHTMMYTGGDIGNCVISSDGLPVLWKDRYYACPEELISLIETQLEHWIDDERVQLGDIVLLSPLSYENSVASRLDKRWRRKIAVINESFCQRWMDTQLPFSSIRDFKGLENRYVMMLDLDAIVDEPQAINQLYVGMTRANAVLWMATPSSNRDWFDRRRLENAQAVAEYARGHLIE